MLSRDELPHDRERVAAVAARSNCLPLGDGALVPDLSPQGPLRRARHPRWSSRGRRRTRRRHDRVESNFTPDEGIP
jgi:hypothetical protein